MLYQPTVVTVCSLVRVAVRERVCVRVVVAVPRRWMSAKQRSLWNGQPELPDWYVCLDVSYTRDVCRTP